MSTGLELVSNTLGLAAKFIGIHVPDLVTALFLSGIKDNCDKVAVRKSECRNLANKAAKLTETLEESRRKLQGSELLEYTTEIESVLRKVLVRTSEWARWSRIYTFVHEGKLAEGIQQCVNDIDAIMDKYTLTTMTIANCNMQEILTLIRNQDAKLRDLSVQILSDPNNVMQLAAAEEGGQHIARPIIEQGQLQLRELRELRRADMTDEEFQAIQRGLSQLYSLTKIPPTVKRLDGEVVRTGDFPVNGGTYSDIWLGLWLANHKVALKAMRGISASADKARLRFERELNIWAHLTHPRILPFLGIVTDIGPFISLVAPWQDNGDIRGYLSCNPLANRLRLVHQASEGLAYLHVKGIIHGNVKGSNILISEQGEALISDFGMSKVIEEISDAPASATLTKSRSLRWLAPELLQPDGTKIAPACDVYSFSMTILECLTLRDPFSNVKRDIHIVTQLLTGTLPERPDLDDINPWLSTRDRDDLWRLMVACWSLQPARRPSMSEVFQRLAGLVGELDLLSPEQLVQRVTRSRDEEADSAGAEQALMSYRGDKAEKAMEILYQMLTDTNVTTAPRLRRLITKLSRESHIIPTFLFLQDPPPYDAEHRAHGGFADIYRARYGGNSVALKRINRSSSITDGDIARVASEVLVWCYLRHPNILPFLGVDKTTFKGYLCLVSPWMSNGDIMSCAKALASRQEVVPLDRWLIEGARGLGFLHGEHLVHGDIRGANVLIDSEFHVRLTDFGLTTFDDVNITSPGNNGGGSMRWMCPHLFESVSRPNFSCDIYSFGCLCLEVFSGKPPYPTLLKDPQVAAAKVLKRPPETNNGRNGIRMHDKLWTLVNACWDQDPSRRPSATRLIDELVRIFEIDA